MIGNQSAGSKTNKSTMIGMVTGALISGVASYFLHKGVEKRDAKVRRDTLFNLDRNDVSVPSGFGFSSAHGISAPKVESEWVPTRVQGKKLIEGHKVWLITDDVKWVPGLGKRKSK